MDSLTPEDFKQDVIDELEAAHDSGPGKVGAFNPAGFLDRVDAFAQKVAPLLGALAPPQYALLVQAVVALIHAGDGALHQGQ